MTKQSDLLMIFPVVVQVTDIPGTETLNEHLCKGAYDLMKVQPNTKPDAWACNVYTTIHSGQILSEVEPFSSLKSIILRETEKYATDLKFDVAKHPLRISECWLNVYGKGHGQDIHVHSNNVFSGIYYPKAPQGCGDLILHSPAADQMLEPPITEVTGANTSSFRIPPVAGRMVLFRSWLRHSVMPSEIEEDRISIAFNILM
jgi:uncharacterized protein (TIGR02466 family)